MPFCPQCGIDNPDAARFCDQCGAALIPVSSSQPTTVTPAVVPVPTTPAALPNAAQTCPQCGQGVIPGEAFCDNCGAPLSAPAISAAPAALPVTPAPASVAPQPSYPSPQPSYPTPQPTAPAIPAVAPATAAVGQPQQVLAPARLVVVATGASLPLPSSTQAIIGRADPVSRFAPDIDLTTHGALDQGVGRRHSRIFLQNGQLMLEDLDSTNGTSLNGQRVTARQAVTLKNGDTIQFGRLALQILL